MSDLHASSNYWSTDKNPAATRKAVLRVLADLPMYHALSRRLIQYRVFGTDLVGAGPTASAVGWLRSHGYIERVAGRKLCITDVGRKALDEWGVFESEAS